MVGLHGAHHVARESPSLFSLLLLSSSPPQEYLNRKACLELERSGACDLCAVPSGAREQRRREIELRRGHSRKQAYIV